MINLKKSQQKTPTNKIKKKKRQCIQRENILKGKKLNMNWKTCRSAQLAKLIIQNIYSRSSSVTTRFKAL